MLRKCSSLMPCWPASCAEDWSLAWKGGAEGGGLWEKLVGTEGGGLKKEKRKT